MRTTTASDRPPSSMFRRSDPRTVILRSGSLQGAAGGGGGSCPQPPVPAVTSSAAAQNTNKPRNRRIRLADFVPHLRRKIDGLDLLARFATILVARRSRSRGFENVRSVRWRRQYISFS